MIEQLPWLFILIGVVLTVGTGYFVASEFSLVNLDRSELDTAVVRGWKSLRVMPQVAAR